MSGTVINTAAIANGGNFTIAAGSSRRVAIVGALRRDTGVPTYSATLGGVPMNLDVQSPYGGSGDDILLIFSLLEASLPSGSQPVSVSASGGTILGPFHGQAYTLGGVDQTALDTGFTSSNVATAVTSVTTGTLVNAAGSVLLYGVRDSTGDAITGPGGWTVDVNDGGSGGMVQTAHIANASANSATYTWASTTNNWIYATVAYKAAGAANSGTSKLPLVGVGALAPLAWIINRRNRLLKHGKKS